jgi:hypothetical protein
MRTVSDSMEQTSFQIRDADAPIVLGGGFV